LEVVCQNLTGRGKRVVAKFEPLIAKF